MATCDEWWVTPTSAQLIEDLTIAIHFALTALTVATLVVGQSTDVDVMKARQASSGIDGSWQYDYPCKNTTGLYAERCARGEGDTFSLSISHSGPKFCGAYALTAQAGNHADEGDLKNWSFQRVTDGTYRLHFDVSGEEGEALIRRRGAKMLWRLINEREKPQSGPLDYAFSLPGRATLHQQRDEKARHPLSCRG